MDTRLNNGMCRCCASEGTFKDICSTYHWMGDEEIYSDMLKECFDINLNTLEAGDEGGICEVCITQLRNASNFKKQVLQTEQHFKKRLQDKLFKTSIVKVELPAPDEEVDSDNDNNISEDFSGPEYEVPIKLETQDEPKGKKRAAKATTSRAKKAKLDDGEPSTKRTTQTQRAVTEMEMVIIKEELIIDDTSIIKEEPDEDGTTVIQEELDETSSKRSAKLTRLAKMAQYRTNIIEIMRCSNATPISKKTGLGYACCFCNNYFQKPADLKTHTIVKHNDFEKSNLVENKDILSRFYLKIDITALHCKLCESEMASLELLMGHLKIVHNKTIHTDIENVFLPLKFDSEAFRCCICSNVFNIFKNLLDHMNDHYRNCICDVCDAGYLTQKRLSDHKHCHNTGIFKCDHCPRVFDTHRKRKLHEYDNHVHSNPLHNCEYCEETFTRTKLKDEHVVAVHGVQIQHKCQFCEQEFDSRRSLQYHTKRKHMMEKLQKCTECEKSFYTLAEVKIHMLTHIGVKEFQCELCPKKFLRKCSLLAHMRIHNDDRRFKCQLCENDFVHKASWKIHMRAKHGEIV